MRAGGDNFTVGLNRGRIIEEDHYYAFGLKIAATSSQKLGDPDEGMLKNNYLYQGSFSEFDDDVNLNDFELRNYDLQIGRWIQQDPFNEFPSTYTGMCNDPVNLIDPSGGGIGGLSGWEQTITTTIIGIAAGGIAGAISGDGDFKSVLKGAAIGTGAGAIIGSEITKIGSIGSWFSTIEVGLIGGHGGKVAQEIEEHYLKFTGMAQDGVGGFDDDGNYLIRQYAEGTLELRRKTKATDQLITSFAALSGPGLNGLLPNGEYDLTNREETNEFPDESGRSFKYRLHPSNSTIPKVEGARNGLLIHPMQSRKDGVLPNGEKWYAQNSWTNGCIGLCGGWKQVKDFDERMQNIFRTMQKSGIRVKVAIELNANTRVNLGNKLHY